MQQYKDFFIPHAGNQYAPHVLQKVAVLGMTLLVLLSFATVNLQSFLWMSSDWLISAILPAVVVQETNVERTTDSLVPLQRNPLLDAAAQLKAEHMADNQYFAHYSPDGVSPWYWFNQVSYNFVHAGENLAIHFTDSAAVVDAWMNSPTHRANIMNSNYTEIGVGAVEGTYQGFPTVYVVQLFGRPAVAAESVAVVPSQAPPPPEAAALNPNTSVLAATASNTELLAVADSPASAVAAGPTTTSPALAAASEPLPVPPVTDTDTVAEDVRVAETFTTSTPTTVPETVIEDVVVTERSVALYANEVSTSTSLTPAPIDSSTTLAGTTDDTSTLLAATTQPHRVLAWLYIAIGSFVVAALFLSILIEIRRQQPLQIAYGVALLLLMIGLYQFHVALTSGVLVA